MTITTKLIPFCSPIIKYGLIAIVATGVISLSSSHYILQQANPLENLQAVMLGPIYENTQVIEVSGTFDRKVSCTLNDFSFELRSQDDETLSILLGVRHMIKGPSPDTGPGTDLKINFKLKLPPGQLTPGVWQPKFNGKYSCKYGIFKDYKEVEVVGNSINVKPKEPDPVMIPQDNLKVAVN